MPNFSLISMQYSNSVVANGENVDTVITIRNDSTNKKSIHRVRLFMRALTTSYGSSSNSLVCDTSVSGLDIAPGKSATISIPGIIKTSQTEGSAASAQSIFNSNPSLRTLTVKTTIQTYASDGSMSAEGSDTWPKLTLLNMRYRPGIAVFDIKRTPDDEGINLALTTKLVATGNASLLSAKIYWLRTNENEFPIGAQDGVVDLTQKISMSTLLSGVSNNTTLIQGEFSNGSDWCFMLWFGDAYESTRKFFSVDDASANVHLSGRAKGGVRFGGFSTATDLAAKFECDYPTYLYGNIVQIGGDADSSEVWEELALASANITTPGTYGDILKIRRIENKCIIKGGVMVKPGDSVVIADLPEDYKPMVSTFRINACQGARIARIAVGGTDGDNYGKLVLSWVYNIGGSQYTDNAIWVDCSIEYWID